ncbi:MAG: adenylyltransferase/cytidyltransferase family protein, partial [Planctomycetota bacterium]
MRAYSSLDTLSPGEFRNPIVTIGVFDGMHRGHLHLIKGLCRWAEEGGGESVVITFRQHPQAVLGRIPPAALTSVEHRMALLERAGVDATVVLDFDLELASLSAERFVKEILHEKIGARRLLMGYNSAFGAGARGTYESLHQNPELGVEVRQQDPLNLDGRPISSTEVRSAILNGDLECAAHSLGRPVSIIGEVIRGDGRGKS